MNFRYDQGARLCWHKLEFRVPKTPETPPKERSWLDQRTAKRLIKEYLQVSNRAGASALANEIERKAGMLIPRRTLEEWLRQSGRMLKDHYFSYVLKFIGTPDFLKRVPHASESLFPRARLTRLGSAFFEVYGMPDASAASIFAAHSFLHALWADDNGTLISMSWVNQGNFSTIHIVIPSYDVYSGLVFSTGDGAHLGMVWSRTNYDEARFRLWVDPRSPHPDRRGGFLYIDLGNMPEIGDLAYPLGRSFGRGLLRFPSFHEPLSDELTELFDNLDLDVLPNGISEKKTRNPA